MIIMRKILLLFCLSSYVFAIGQGKSQEDYIVSYAKRFVLRVNKDTSLKEDQRKPERDSLKKAVNDTIGVITAYYKKNQLQKVVTYDDRLRFLAWEGLSKEYFIENGRLIAYIEKDSQASQMGSCGQQIFEHHYYFQGRSVIWMETKLPIHNCYSNWRDVQTEKTILGELVNILQLLKLNGFSKNR
jgi:hypothetical protein